MMCLAVAAAGAFNTMSASVAMAQEGAEGASVMRPLFNGKYEMPGMKYNKYEQDQITDLASNSKFSPGLSGASDALLGVASLLLCVYLFIGIAIAQDILMGAIAKITSQTESVEVKNAEGKSMTVAVPLWNSSIVYLTLMAIGGALPEIFLCFMSTFSEGGRVPTEIGPMAVVGSASFNLLIVSGLSIAAVTEVKRILNMNVFLVMAAFAAFAYVWLFLVLVVISPGEIDFAEAMVTLMFYPALLVAAWFSEYLSPEERDEQEELEHNRRLVCKQNIVDAADAQGSFYVVDLVTGASDSFEAETLRADFKIVLGVEDLSTVTVDELLNVIDPECPVARLTLRKASKKVSEVEPVAQSDAEAQQQQNQEDEKRQKLIQQQMMMRDPSWSEQFKLAVTVDEEMSGCEAFASFLAMPWKLLFAAIPPRSFMNGWATLAACAVSICALTYVMTEVMMFMGFLLDFRGCILALIMVSLGTSINNLKSSMQSAAANKSADDVFLPTIAANAANIFVGLGLPWTIATVYRYANDQGSLVIGQYEAFDINFAVVTFLCCALVTALVLSLRRSCLGGELGGPRFSKYLSSFMMSFLWTIFIVLNCLNCYGYFGATFMPESIQGLSASALEPVPMIKACQTENTDTCGVRMTWSPSSGLQSSSMRYRLEVMDRYNQFHPLSQLCGVQSNMMDCEVPMETFTDAPFFLEEGAPVLVRASAFINNSWGSPSNVDYNGARVIGAPGRMTQVRASGVTDSSVTLTWESVDGMGPNDKYEIYFSQTGGLGDYIYWTSVTGNSFEVQNLYPNQKYYFRVRGKNPCGVCSFSEPLEVRTTSTPVTITPSQAVQHIKIEKTVDDCSVKVMWNRPADCDPDTTNYRVSVQAASGNMVLLHQCGNSGRSQECLVPMSDLAGFSYGLNAGMRIVAQVQACSTLTGNCGILSPLSTEVVNMAVPPRQPQMPRWTNRGANTVATMYQGDTRSLRPITLEWESMNGVENYQVLWDNGWGGVNFRPAQDINQLSMTPALVTKYEHTVLEDKWTIQYRVRACNSCGCSDSEILVVQCRSETNKPGVMQPVTSTLGPDCDVRFTWYEPNEDGGEPITGYKIEVQGADGQYHIMQSCSNQPLRNRGVMNCNVSMSELSAAPFFLQSGDSVMVSGKAYNSNGYSTDRSVAQGGVRMQSTGLEAPHLRIEGVPRDYINLAWTDIANAQKYEVEWDQGMAWDVDSMITWVPYRKSLDGGFSSDTTQLPTMRVNFDAPQHNGVANSDNYRFRVRAIGGCGGSNPYSNILHVCLTEDPPIMPTVTTETVGCAVRINIGRAIGGAVPENIKVQIQGSDYQYYSDNLPCSEAGDARECVVHQDTLKSYPYNLRPGHLVIVRVAGKNASGWGAFSGPNTIGAPIASVPYKLAEPVVVDQTQSSLSIQWNRYYGTGVGQSVDIDYQLQVCRPVVTGECDWEDLRYTSGTTHTEQNMTPGVLYKFRVRAVCVCEQADWSDELCVELSSPPLKPGHTCPRNLDQCLDFSFQWTRPTEEEDGIQLPNDYRVQVKTSTGSWEDYQCDIWGSMEQCPLSTSRLMQAPFNLVNGDSVQTRLYALNDAGQSPVDECLELDAKIRTNPCVPTNFRRDTENVNDREQNGSQICFRWNDCAGRSNVRWTVYSQAWDLSRNRYAENSVPVLGTTTDQPFGCMDYPSTDNTAYHYWVEASTLRCDTEQSEHLPFRHTEGPVCNGCFDVSSRQCSVIFSLPDCDSMGGQIIRHPLSIRGKDGDYYELNAQDINNNEKCHWNSWDRYCEVSMTVFNKSPFNLLDGDQIHARTYAAKDSSNSAESRSDDIENGGVGCQDVPTMKPLPQKVVWGNDAIIEDSKQAIHIQWPDICDGVEGCHYEVVYSYPNSGFRPQREITSSNQFRLLAPAQGVQYCFTIETCNECGAAEPSEQKCIDVCEEPGTPVCMFSNPKQCSMVVDWLMPQDTPVQLIDTYEISFAKRGLGSDKSQWTWNVVDGCGSDGRTTCDLDMKKVIAGDYGLINGGNPIFEEGDLIYARVIAVGTCPDEFGLPSRSAEAAYDHSPVELRTGAQSIDTPTCQSVSEDEIEVCWEAPNADGGYQYTLLWNNQNNALNSRYNRVNVFAQPNQNGKICYNYRTDASSSVYNFKVAAENDCSFVESQSCRVDNARVPDQPVCSTEVVDCDMEITWNPVSANGSAVTNYIIEIQDQYGFYRETSTCMNTFNNKCLVSMRELAMDYGLVEGEDIHVQIYAENGIGRSIAGHCSSCHMKSLPDEVSTPQVLVDNDEQIQIGWAAAPNCDSSYESDCHYEVTVSIDGVSQVYTTPQLTYSEFGLDRNAQYCFQVRACNSCGVGQRSEPVCIDQCIKPLVPAKPRVIPNQDDATIDVKWNYDPTSACFNQRCHYTIIITSNDGEDPIKKTTWEPNFKLTNVDPTVQYCFKVNCCNDCGESEYSMTACSEVCQACGTIQNLRHTDNSDKLIRIQWSGSTSDYIVGYEEDPSDDKVRTYVDVKGRNYYEIVNPGCNTCYEFTVKCTTEQCGTGIETNPYKVTTEDCCQHPGNLARPNVVMEEDTGIVTVAWNVCDSGSVSGFADDCIYDLQYTLGSGQESYFETMDTNRFSMNIVQGINYCFRVRAKNSCANGMWSHEECRSVCAAPEEPSVPTLVRKSEDSITVEWETCKTNGQECSDCYYELEITRDNGVPEKQIIYNRTQYTIENPRSSTPYHFRVKCHSTICRGGPWSPRLTEQVCNTPDAPVCPVELCPAERLDANGECRDNKITVQWQHATGCENSMYGHHMCHYELTYSYSQGQQVIERTVYTNDLEFTLFDPLDGVEYNFCVVACNECGKSAKSQCLDVERSTCSKPLPPTCISSSIADCQVQFYWFNGQDNGCAITEYKIYIMDRANMRQEFNARDCGSDMTNQACNIDMKVLQAAPYFLRIDDEIKVRATAINSAGESELSTIEDHHVPIFMLDTPRTLNKPTTFGKDATGFSLSWTRLDINDQVEVFCGANNQTPTRVPFNNRGSSSLGQSTRIAFEPGTRIMSCFILSCNDCGCSGASEVEVITLTDVPATPQISVFGPSPCEVQVNWQLGQNGGSPIDQISIEIAERNWDWTEWTGRCGNVGSNSCRIAMNDLGQYSRWSLAHGDRIQIRVRAHNENGWSGYSADHAGIVRMITSPEKMDTPTSQIDSNFITIYWQNRDYEEIDVKWSSRTPRYSYASPEENMENDFTTTGNQMIIDTRGLNSANYRFVIRKTNECGDAPWSQELTVACPQCHQDRTVVNEEPEPWANFIPCNPNDASSACHHLLQSSRPTNYLPPPAAAPRPPRPMSSPNHGSNDESRWSRDYNTQDRSPQPSYNYNDVNSRNTRDSRPVYHSTQNWGYPEPACDFNDPNSDCFQAPDEPRRQQEQTTFCDPRRPLLPCHNQVMDNSTPESETCDSSDPSSPCFNPFASWDQEDVPFWDLPERDFDDARVNNNNDHWDSNAEEKEECDGTDKPCHHEEDQEDQRRNRAPQPVAPSDDGCGPNHSGPCWHSTGNLDPYAGGWETNECPEPVAPETPTVDAYGQMGGQVHVDWTSWRLSALRDVSYEVQMAEGRFGDWRTVSKYSSRTNFIGNCMHPDGCNFRVRTETECGSVSPWSGAANSKTRTNNTPNNSMVRTFPSQTECGVVIQWDRAPSNGSRPMALQVFIQKRNGEYSSSGLSQFCDGDSDTTQCTVDSEHLRAQPFLLNTGDDVVAKVTVQYSSWKVTYETDSNGYDVAKLGSRPGKVDQPIVIKAENSSIDVEWQAPNDEQGLQYELVWNNGIGNEDTAQYTPLTQPYTFGTKYNRGSLIPGREYLFKVRAINTCGSGEFSKPQGLSINQKPQRPGRPSVTETNQHDQCGVKIKWSTVVDGGSPITAYFIEINDATDRSVDMSECAADHMSTLECFVKCTTLQTMGLDIGDVVSARVKAENSVGTGEWSHYSTENTVVTLPPQQMDAPRTISKTGDSITITWAALTEEKTNGIAVTSYKIAYQQCDTDGPQYEDCGEWVYTDDPSTCGNSGDELRVDCSAYQSLYDITGLNAQKYYNIKISARNKCGLGDYSEYLQAETNFCPTKPTGVVTDINGANVDIKWDEQSNIDSWEVLFQHKDHSWDNIAECSGTGITTAGGIVQCSILNSKIKSETSLEDQDLIIVKIRGSNANCSGPWSAENTGNAKIASCPIKMAKPFVNDQSENIKKESIKLSWTQLSGLDAGGEGIEITKYIIHYEQLEELDGDAVPGTAGTSEADGDKSSWTHEGIDNAQTWRYKIRAVNAVGDEDCSPWSDTASFVSGEPPSKPDEPSVCIQNDTDCLADSRRMRLRGANGGDADTEAPKVIISWPAGSDDDNVTKYEVKVLNGDGEFVVHPDCDVEKALEQEVDGVAKCELTMASFWDGEFALDQGTYITITVRAENDKGWSEYSRWNTEGAMVQKVPSMMNPPSGLRDEQNNDVNLEWNKVRSPRDGGSEILTYVLKFDSQDENDWETLLGETDSLCIEGATDTECTFTTDNKVQYTHTGSGNDKLSYKIAAKNQWGTGKFSRPNLEIDVAQAPDQIDEVRINDSGMVRITWDDPQSGGSVIDTYEVQIKNNAGNWVTPSDSCKNDETDAQGAVVTEGDIKAASDSDGNPIHLCRIDMLSMPAEYGLEYDAAIVARVRAVNAAQLQGEWRESNDDAKVKTAPKKMTPAPTRGQSTTSTTLHVKWDKITDEEAKGGSEIIYYSVYIGDEVDAIYSTSEDFYLYAQQASEASQKFRVSATNIYGPGEKSDVSADIKFGAVPSKLTDLKSENIDAANEEATITWGEPDAADNITEYNFEILNLDTNQYDDASSIMTDTASTDLGQQFSCQELIDSFGYQKGDTIEFRVSATNEFGDSEWAYPTEANQTAESLSMLIL